MPNPVQKQPNDEELAGVSALFEEYEIPYHRYEAQSAQSGGNGPGFDTSVIAKRMALATGAAEAVFNYPDSEPEFEPDDVASAPCTFTAILEGARSGAEVLSGNRLQGLSEIVQNADDAGANEVRSSTACRQFA